MTSAVPKAAQMIRSSRARAQGTHPIPKRVSSLMIATAMLPIVALTGCANHSENDFTRGLGSQHI